MQVGGQNKRVGVDPVNNGLRLGLDGPGRPSVETVWEVAIQIVAVGVVSARNSA